MDLKRQRSPFPWLLAAVLATGMAFAAWMVRRADQDIREDLILHAQSLVQAVDVTNVAALTGTRADLENPRYQRIEGHLRVARSLYPQCRFLYIMGRKADGTVFIFVDSELPDSPNYSPPGEVYDKFTPALSAVFDTNIPITEGPVGDQYGTWVSGLAPIADPRTGQVLAVLGVDMDSRVWREELIRAALPAGYTTLVLAVILLVGSALHTRRAAGNAPKRWHRHLEVGLVAACGLTMTVAAGWLVFSIEARRRHETIERLASSQAEAVVERLKNLRNSQLESLAQFYMANEEVTDDELQLFSRSLQTNLAVLSWNWVPVVPAADRAAFEVAARARGLAGYHVWEQDEQGRRQPAGPRAVYFPVLAVAPRHPEVLGFDAASETQSRAALEAAMRSGLTTGTEPLGLVQQTSSRNGMMVYRPVYAIDDAGKLRGFVGAAVDMGNLLKGGIVGVTPYMELSLLRPGAAPEVLASTVQLPATEIRRSTPRPFFAFGKVFSVAIYEEAILAQENPLRAGGMALLVGAMLTGAGVMIVRLSRRQRERLERLVAAQTGDLRARTAFFEALVDSSPDGILVVDSTGKKILQNRRLEEIWKIPPEVLSDPDDRRQVQYVTSQVRNPGEFKAKVADLYAEPAAVSRDLIELVNDTTLDRYTAPVRDAQGKFYGRIWIFRDITERRKAAEALEQAHFELQERIKEVNCLYSILKLEEGSGAPLRELLEGAVHLIPPAWLHPESACARITCDGEEFLSAGFRRTPWAMSAPIVIGGVARGVVEVCYREEKPVQHEGPFLTEERNLIGNLATQIGFLIERKRTEEKLHRLSSIIEQAPLSVVITNLQGIVEYVNPKFSAVTGYAPGEVLGEPVDRLWSDEVPQDVRQKVGGTVVRREVWIGEVRSRKKNGDSYLENVVVAPLLDENGRVTHYVALKDDITAQKRFEAETTAMLRQERKISEMKSQFITVTSHEFRTPLTAAVGSLELLQRHAGQVTEAKRVELLDRTQRSLARLTEIIDQVLSISRVESGRVTVKLLAVELPRFVQDVINEVGISDRQQHRFAFAQTGAPQVVPVDTSLLHHVLTNLLGNAVRYSPAGSTIAVTLDLAATEFVLTVADEGMGVPEADRASIFEPFIRGSNVGQIGGTGLGLNIVKRYVELMGGTIGLIPSARGATFQARIPHGPAAT
jgi:PAS domain S-box-containing protein